MKNLETKQKIFDKVVKHLFKQGVKAYEGSVCSYLTDDGLKCAVGCLIPYNRLNNFQPDGVVDNLLDYAKDYCKDNPKNKTAEDFKVFIKTNKNLLQALQTVHDDNNTKDYDLYLPELKSSLIKVAKRYKLNYNHLKELNKEYN
jgi:hypothetical protein